MYQLSFQHLKMIKEQIKQTELSILRTRQELFRAMEIESDLIERGAETDDIMDELNDIQNKYFEQLKKIESLNIEKENEIKKCSTHFIWDFINETNKHNIAALLPVDKVGHFNETLKDLEIDIRLGDTFIEENAHDLPF